MSWVIIHVGALCAGFLLDLVVGDPQWIPHPVRLIGSWITFTERWIRAAFPKTPKGELIGGCLFTAIVMLTSGLGAAAVTMLPVMLLLQFGFATASMAAAFILETVSVCYAVAVRSMRTESMKVQRALEEEDLFRARSAVSMIVGRDTENLTKEGVAKAAVETVAEGTSDGIVSPLFWIALFGPVGGWIYKAVNTMDSMVGYRNDRYLYFGRCAARTDDVFNYIPSRIAAVLMIAAAGFLGLDSAEAYHIWKRDHRNHKSPNSAQTESACAGALGLRLAGDAWYFGKKMEKPFIGDEKKKTEPSDITEANRLMYGTAGLAVFFAAVIRFSVLILIAG
ncbi:MAG: adenosylcobinamide-phosphate synthase CbiB [Bacillota bacterium]|nr:adenosylcobinamide-phosphate synthase CbiB [Bacillota bacterium]